MADSVCPNFQRLYRLKFFQKKFKVTLKQIFFLKLFNSVFFIFLTHLFVLLTGLYLKWKNKETKVITENILATNGIIHIVDKFLLSTPYQTTTVPTTRQTSVKRVSSAHCNISSLSTLSFSVLVTLSVYLFIFR